MSAQEKPPLGSGGMTSRGPMRLRLRALAEELPNARLASFGPCELLTEGRSHVKVLASAHLLKALLRAELFSSLWEDGGFLIGRAYSDLDCDGDAYIVTLNAAPRASATRASGVHLTYTGDSFTEVKRSLREEFPEQQLVGWYHTHLFAAEEEMGLSGVDLRLHFSTFRQHWQIAGLINLVPGKPPVLRFYAGDGGTMILCSLYCQYSSMSEGI